MTSKTRHDSPPRMCCMRKTNVGDGDRIPKQTFARERKQTQLRASLIKLTIYLQITFAYAYSSFDGGSIPSMLCMDFLKGQEKTHINTQ